MVANAPLAVEAFRESDAYDAGAGCEVQGLIAVRVSGVRAGVLRVVGCGCVGGGTGYYFLGNLGDTEFGEFGNGSCEMDVKVDDVRWLKSIEDSNA